MGVYRFNPIVLKYEGLEADQNLIDLGQLGQSIQGAARLLANAGTIVETGHYAKKYPAMSVRVVTGPSRSGSFEIVAFLISMVPIAAPTPPMLEDFTKTSATKAVTGIVNYAIAKLGGRKKESEMAIDLAAKALAEMGQTSRTAIEAIERVALSQRPSVRLIVAPVGESCETAQIGEISNGAVLV